MQNKVYLCCLFYVSLLIQIGCSQNITTFNLVGTPVEENQQVGIRGNTPPLDWSKSIPLEQNSNKYSIEVAFPSLEKEIEFKFVLFTDDNNPTWETIENRTLNLNQEDRKITSNNIWNKEQVIDISRLEKIESDKLKEDFELIKTMILDVHPGTYRYNNASQIKLALEQLENEFSESITHQEAYLAISKLTAQIKCDHTKAGFNNQSKLINSIIHYQDDKLPFTFKWIDNAMVIIENASSNNKLNKGVRILSINKIPVVDIQKSLMKYVGADGATDKNRIYKLQVDGYDFRYNAFDILYPLLYPIEDQKVDLELQQPNTKTIDVITVPTLSREKRFTILAERFTEFPKSRDDMWNFKTYPNSTAVLTINSFGLRGWKAMTLDYKTYLADVFNQIDELKIKHLIIDIRENTGGFDEMAEVLFSYLSEKNYNFDRVAKTRYIDFPEKLKSHIKIWDANPWYFNLNPTIKTPQEGYYIFEDNFSRSTESSDKKVFQGKLFLLTSPANTSLAFYTANRFRLQKLGTIIGSETGGNLNDINGGNILFLNLPNSKIEIDFPVMGGFSSHPMPDSGVIPDIMIDYTVQDIIQNRDLELEKAFEIIEKF